jgi:poly-gamma-glutamate synthesis protein (capsule biosynthesis protein)
MTAGVERSDDEPAASGLSLFLAGDAMLTRAWSGARDPAFARLVAEMRAADVTLANLETVIHSFQGYAQADCGGTYVSSPPEIAAELRWAGIDLLGHANNHAFDWGSTGVLETLAHVEAAGLVLAGSGSDLEAARAPRYCASVHARVGLVAMAATFIRYGKASRSRPDVKGRPGVNPLELRHERLTELTPRAAAALRGIARLCQQPVEQRAGTRFRAFGREFCVGERTRRVRRRSVDAGDAAANLGAIERAAHASDLAIASIHAHTQKRWLPGFARKALAAGADVVFCHGPHKLRGIELVGGKPILYGLGDFAFQVDGVARFPAEAYERLGLGDDATREDVVRADRERTLGGERFAYEGCAAVLRYRGRSLVELRLLPLDLQFDASAEGLRGCPRWADPELGRRIIGRLAALSRPFGTRITFNPARCEGRVELA